MIYPIVKFGDPVLEAKAAPVTEFDAALRKLLDDMFESMYAAHGVGLAAPQIGISRRIAVIDVTFKEDPKAKLVLINPEIIHTEGRISQNEGCLSIPEFRENVTRPKKVTVRAQNAKGEFFEHSGEELLPFGTGHGHRHCSPVSLGRQWSVAVSHLPAACQTSAREPFEGMLHDRALPGGGPGAHDARHPPP